MEACFECSLNHLNNFQNFAPEMEHSPLTRTHRNIQENESSESLYHIGECFQSNIKL